MEQHKRQNRLKWERQTNKRFNSAQRYLGANVVKQLNGMGL